ncbi:PAS domain-containing protein [Cronobacter malonaticus]|nr:PAS domain-containing protein [Cronobacter malonaticus]
MPKRINQQPNLAACYNQIRSMIPTWEQADMSFGAKDIYSRFVYANPAYKRLLDLPPKFDLEGRYDHEMPAPTSEFAGEFQFHDRLVESTQQRKSSLEINEFGKERNLSAYFFDKLPLYDDNNNVIGTIFMGRKAVHLNTDFYINAGRADSILLTKPSDIFTEKEWEVIFYLLRNMSNKQIAEKIQRSVNTVRAHLTSIKNKLGLDTNKQVVDFIHANGWENYIPEKYMLGRRHILFNN